MSGSANAGSGGSRRMPVPAAGRLQGPGWLSRLGGSRCTTSSLRRLLQGGQPARLAPHVCHGALGTPLSSVGRVMADSPGGPNSRSPDSRFGREDRESGIPGRRQRELPSSLIGEGIPDSRFGQLENSRPKIGNQGIPDSRFGRSGSRGYSSHVSTQKRRVRINHFTTGPRAATSSW